MRRIVAVCFLLLATATSAQEAPAFRTLPARHGDTAALMASADLRKLRPLWFQIRLSTDVLLDSDAAAVNGLRASGLTIAANEAPESCGTGVIISSNGYVVTAAHVVHEAKHIQVLTAAGPRFAICTAYDEANDLAILKLPAGRYDAVRVRPSSAVPSGEAVVMIGIRILSRWGFVQRLARGVVRHYPYDPRYWQANVPGEPGHSGGALLDERGELVGVIQQGREDEQWGAGCEHPTEITTVALKSGYVLPLLPRSADLPQVAAFRDLEAAISAAEPAVVTILSYGTSHPPVNP